MAAATNRRIDWIIDRGQLRGSDKGLGEAMSSSPSEAYVPVGRLLEDL